MVLNVDSWVGKRCPLVDLLVGSASAELSSGSAAIILVDGGCQKCRAYLKRRPVEAGERIYVADIAPRDVGTSGPAASGPFRLISLADDVNVAADVPVELSLKNGTVTKVSRPTDEAGKEASR